MSIRSLSSIVTFSISCSFFFVLILKLGWCCDPRDQAALLDISNSLNVSVWPHVIDSSVTDCCFWYGITCSNQSSLNESSTPNPYPRVVILALEDIELYGKLPNSIGGLSYLEILVLNNLFLTGSLPSSLGRLTYLRMLKLQLYSISGTIPKEFYQLQSLQFINLAIDYVSGPLNSGKINHNIDWELLPKSLTYIALQCSSFSNITGALMSFQQLPNLTFIDITGGFYEETLPAVGITGFQNLAYMGIRNAKLKGTLPMWLSTLDKLIVLDLQGNCLTGEIPVFMAQFKSLTKADDKDVVFNSTYIIGGKIVQTAFRSYLSLRDNMFSGNTWMHLTNLTALRYMDLCNNSLSGSIPKDIPKMKRLETLLLQENNISGVIPEQFYQLPSLQVIDISDNHLSGRLSSAIGNLSTLYSIHLNNNKLYGNIPDAFHRLANLQTITLGDNFFTGPVPISLSSCSNLRVLHVGSNSLSGRVGINFTALSALEVLVLEGDDLIISSLDPILACKALQFLVLRRIEIPENINWELFPTSLRDLYLEGDNFSNITKALLSFQRFQNLTYLGLDGSFRRETLPAVGITGFPNLKILVIRNAKLMGTLPMWLSKLDKLIALDLSRNCFTGEIPIFMSQLKGLIKIDNKGEEFMYGNDNKGTIMKVFYSASLHLAHNMFSGNTWMHLSNLTALHSLDLSHNSLTGSIPNDFTNLKWLQNLDLSSNNISGSIPSSLEELNYLSEFCVANNRLTGDVPTRHQFSTFRPECFEGNPGLCYGGKSRCHHQALVPPNPGEENEERVKVIDMGLAFVIGVSVGYVITFLAGVTHYFYTLKMKLYKHRRS